VYGNKLVNLFIGDARQLLALLNYLNMEFRNSSKFFKFLLPKFVLGIGFIRN